MPLLNYADPNSFMGVPTVPPADSMGSGIFNFGQGAGQTVPLPGGSGYDFSGQAPFVADAGVGAAAQPAQQGWLGKTGSWLAQPNNLASVMQGIGTLTQAYLSFQQLKMAKEGLALQKESYRTNMANSTQSYNTSLEDRIRGRTADYAGKENDVQSYLNANRLKNKVP